MKYKFINKYKNKHCIEKMAKLFGVSRSGYYSWKNRPICNREKQNKEIINEIKKIYSENKGVYGYPRIHIKLKQKGIECCKNRVARLMRENNIKAKTFKKFKATTDSEHNNFVAANLLNREFKVYEPNKVWVSDITYIYTHEGWLYLCVIIDLFSRKVIGWSTSNRIGAKLLLNAFMVAIVTRKPKKEVIFHSDRGVQYASKDFQRKLKKYGFICSMSRKGNCWDNACAESFFHTLKVEEVNQIKYRNRDEARAYIFEYIEVFYNRKRIHSSLGYVSPEEYEIKKRA